MASKKTRKLRGQAAEDLLRETGDAEQAAEYMEELDAGQHDDALVEAPKKSAAPKKKANKATEASDGQVIVALPKTTKAELVVGNIYNGTDGKSYQVLTVNASSVIAMYNKKKIPFPRAMFEVLVGVKSEDDYKAEKEARRLARKEASKDPKAPRISTMSVIRTALANNLEATIEEIRAACKAAGVPAKSDSTIKTIMSDFKQVYQALFDADRIVID